MFFTRNITKKLEKAVSRSPVVLLTGARQTGKTTLVKHLGTIKNYSYVTFDDLRFLAAAKNDPIGFIQGVEKPVILDEVQRVPEIFLAIKHDVDESRIPGRFILTGSANPLLIPRLGDSLAGRIEILELLPLSQGELLGIQEKFLDCAFNKNCSFAVSQKEFSKAELYQTIIRGGYPLVQNYDDEGREEWFNSYITMILQRDVQDLAAISAISEMPHLLRLLASRVGNLLNVAELGRTTGIASTTLHRYMTLLETVFLVVFQPAWHSNLGKRLTKSPKTYLVDTGLLSFLLDIRIEKALSDYRFIGSVLENFVFNELQKQATWNSTRIKLYHYRTITGIEVGIVLENQAGNIVGIEVKNSETVNSQDFKGLSFLKEESGESFIKGILLYNGSQIIPFGKDLYAVPIHALWTSQ